MKGDVILVSGQYAYVTYRWHSNSFLYKHGPGPGCSGSGQAPVSGSVSEQCRYVPVHRDTSSSSLTASSTATTSQAAGQSLQPPLWRFAANIAAIRRLYIGLRVRYKYYRKNSRFLAWSRPRAERGLSRPTSVFRTTIVVCKIVSRSVEIWQYTRAKSLFWVKTEHGEEAYAFKLGCQWMNENVTERYTTVTDRVSQLQMLQYKWQLNGRPLWCS